jgi:hypothetical protein
LLQTAWFIVHQLFFTFQMRTCAGARILLLEDPFDRSLYSRELVIGDRNNTKIRLLDASENVVLEKDVNGLVHCSELRPFWISWNWQIGELRVGKGLVNTEEILHYVDAAMSPFHAVSVSTGDGFTGEWQFTRDVGQL